MPEQDRVEKDVENLVDLYQSLCKDLGKLSSKVDVLSNETSHIKETLSGLDHRVGKIDGRVWAILVSVIFGLLLTLLERLI
jgi:archaellum component FlaC